MIVNVNLIMEEHDRIRKEATGETWVGLVRLGLETAEKRIADEKAASGIAN